MPTRRKTREIRTRVTVEQEQKLKSLAGRLTVSDLVGLALDEFCERHADTQSAAGLFFDRRADRRAQCADVSA